MAIQLWYIRMKLLPPEFAICLFWEHRNKKFLIFPLFHTDIFERSVKFWSVFVYLQICISLNRILVFVFCLLSIGAPHQESGKGGLLSKPHLLHVYLQLCVCICSCICFLHLYICICVFVFVCKWPTGRLLYKPHYTFTHQSLQEHLHKYPSIMTSEVNSLFVN